MTNNNKEWLEEHNGKLVLEVLMIFEDTLKAYIPKLKSRYKDGTSVAEVLDFVTTCYTNALGVFLLDIAERFQHLEPDFAIEQTMKVAQDFMGEWLENHKQQEGTHDVRH